MRLYVQQLSEEIKNIARNTIVTGVQLMMFNQPLSATVNKESLAWPLVSAIASKT